MESNNELKGIDIKNHMCYYFDNTLRIRNFSYNNSFLGERSYGNILIYDIS